MAPLLTLYIINDYLKTGNFLKMLTKCVKWLTFTKS